jgi:hypothetical protein
MRDILVATERGNILAADIWPNNSTFHKGEHLIRSTRDIIHCARRILR